MENQRPQDVDSQDLQAQELPVEIPKEAAAENLDLESIIQEFRDLSDENLPDPELPAEMLPHETEEAPAPATGDTIRMDLSDLPKGSYDGAEHITDEPEEEEVTEELEPFSDQWEPEYEQPMGEYVPPQPILFHPQSRLRELKKKLVAGPEKRYYQLMEKGTGKLQVLIIIGLILSLLCIGSTVLYHLGMVQENRLKLMIFGQMLFMFIAALLGSFQLVEGLADLIRLRFSLNTLLLFSFLLCAVDGLFCLQQLRVPCCAPFTLQVVFSLFDTLHRRRTEMSQMDTMRKATNLTSVRQAKDQPQGQKVLLRDAGQVEDFMDSYAQPSKPAKIRSWYVIGALIASLGVGITGAVLYDFTTGLQIAAVTLLAAAPATFFVSLSRPADILEKRFHKLGTLICGWKGVDAACGKVSFPIRHTDLFPGGTVKMNGVKFFGNRNPDEVVAYGTALILSENNGLAPLFEQVLESRNCHHLTAQNVEHLDGGIIGEVRGEPVMVGSLSFLQSQGVEIPEGLRVSNAVCVAVEGVLSGLFAISYEKTRAAASGLHTLTSYRKLNPVIADGDFLITPGFLRSKFGIHSKRLQFADSQRREALAAMEPDPDAPAAVLSTQQNLVSLAYGVTGARALRKASYLGLFIHIIGGIIGIGIMLTLTIIGALHLLTPMHVMLYQLIWCLPGILATEWSRLI